MARYIERAGFMCRLLQGQTEALVDRPVGEIEFGWRRIYATLDLQPLGGVLGDAAAEEFHIVDAYLLTDELTFEDTNPESVFSCIRSGRENARHIRNCISDQMWTALNTEYLRIQPIKLTDIWASSPSSFYSELLGGIDRFSGVAAATMYRDEGWHFFRLGQFVERAQFSCSLLLTQNMLEHRLGDLPDASWRSLLRIFHASSAYDHTYSSEIQPELVTDLLVADRRIPESLQRTVDRTAQELESLNDGPDAASSGALRRLAGRLSALLRYDWPDRVESTQMLRQARQYSRELHAMVNETYFEYPLEQRPRSDAR